MYGTNERMATICLIHSSMFFEKIVEKHAPIQRIKKRGEAYETSKPWLTQELKHLIAEIFFYSINGKKFVTARRKKNLSA